jgi:hypothetical protein
MHYIPCSLEDPEHEGLSNVTNLAGQMLDMIPSRVFYYVKIALPSKKLLWKKKMRKSLAMPLQEKVYVG